MTRRVAVLISLAPALLVASRLQDDRQFVPDHPGKVAVVINHHTNPKATAREAAAFDANLLRMRDRLLAGPMFSPPRGMEVGGWLNLDAKPVGGRARADRGNGVHQVLPLQRRPEDRTARAFPLHHSRGERMGEQEDVP